MMMMMMTLQFVVNTNFFLVECCVKCCNNTWLNVAVAQLLGVFCSLEESKECVIAPPSGGVEEPRVCCVRFIGALVSRGTDFRVAPQEPVKGRLVFAFCCEIFCNRCSIILNLSFSDVFLLLSSLYMCRLY